MEDVNDDDGVEDDAKTYLRSLYNIRNDLCVGTLVRNIRRGLQLARMNKEKLNFNDYEVKKDAKFKNTYIL